MAGQKSSVRFVAVRGSRLTVSELKNPKLRACRWTDGGAAGKILVLDIVLDFATMMRFVGPPQRELNYSKENTNLIVDWRSHIFSQSDKILILEGAEPR